MERTDLPSQSGKGGGEKGRRRKIIVDLIGGRRFIDIPLRIYSLRILFILFMFINHTLPSTMKSPKNPRRLLGALCDLTEETEEENELEVKVGKGGGWDG